MAAYPSVNLANAYARDVLSGKILACRYIKLACQRHFDDLKKSLDKNYPYQFNRDLAERACRFVQLLPHSSGDLAGQKLILEPWQSFIFCSIFGWVTKKDKKRRFREAYIRVARKNGKSFFAAGIGTYMFCADGENSAEVYCGATTMAQAKKVFTPARQMADRLSSLRAKFDISVWVDSLTRPDGSVFAPMAGKPEGLRHVPGDIIEVCDSDYAGVTVGGRVLSVDSLSRTLTLDRQVEIPAGGNVVLNLVGSDGQPVTVSITAHPVPDRVTVSQLPEGVAAYSVWGLKLPTLRQRLFRCVAIRENDDGTYAITAVQHVPEKESIVDNGAKFDPLPGTSITNTPPAVQHLTTEILAEDGQYQARARWDTPRVVKGVNFSLRLTVKAEDNSDRLTSSLTLSETEHTFRNLTPGRYTLTVRAVNSQGQQGDPASTDFSIAAPAVPSYVELTPGYFQITATPRQAVYDPTVQYEFWFTDTQIADIRQVETDARYLGTALYWIAASSGIKPGKDYYFYIRAVNQVGKSAFVEAKGQASNDAAGYLDFFKGEITESHLGKELLEKVELTEDNASRLDEFSKEWQDANGKWNAMWGVKIEQTEDGKHYVAGLGLSMEDTEEGKVSQFLVAADRIAFINPANGNETPAFVMQGDQIFMNEVFLKYLTAPSITSGGNPPTFTLTPDGRLTARNADISGHISANSGALNNVTIEENCTIKGTLRAERILGDIVKAAGREFPYFVISNTGEKRYANGTLTVVIDDDQSFDRQVSIPAITFQGAAYDSQTSNDVWDACTLIVRKNGVEIYNQTSIGVPAVFSRTLDMPAGSGRMTLSFSVSTRGNGSGWPYSRISDLLVIVTKKSSAGITIS